MFSDNQKKTLFTIKRFALWLSSDELPIGSTLDDVITNNLVPLVARVFHPVPTPVGSCMWVLEPKLHMSRVWALDH